MTTERFLKMFSLPAPGRARQGTSACTMAAAALCAAALLLGCQDGVSAPASSASKDRVPGEYLVEMASASAGEGPLRTAFGDLGIAAIEALEGARPLYLLRVETDPGPRAIAERADRVPAIAKVQPNYRYSGSGRDELPEQPPTKTLETP